MNDGLRIVHNPATAKFTYTQAASAAGLTVSIVFLVSVLVSGVHRAPAPPMAFLGAVSGVGPAANIAKLCDQYAELEKQPKHDATIRNLRTGVVASIRKEAALLDKQGDIPECARKFILKD